MDQSSVFTYGLTIVHLYIPFLNPYIYMFSFCLSWFALSICGLRFARVLTTTEEFGSNLKMNFEVGGLGG